MYKAVLWDFGGVLTTSPFESFIVRPGSDSGRGSSEQVLLEGHSGGFRIKPLRHTEWPSPLEGSVELIKQFVAALGLTEHGAGIEPQHRVHVVAVSAGCFGKRHSGSQAGPDREVAA